MTQTVNSGATMTMAVPPVEVRYRGVRKRSSGKYVAEISDRRRQKKQFWLGSYVTGKEAAKIYDAAAWLLRGDKAITNFPQVTEDYLKRAKKILEKHNPLENVTDDNNYYNYNHILPNQINVVRAPSALGVDAARFPLPHWQPPQFRDKYYLEGLTRAGVILPTPASIQKETHMELNLELTLAQPGSI